MELTLSKIQRHGEDDSTVLMPIEAEYGWKGDMNRDNIQLAYNGRKREAFITVKILNPGSGMIIERLYELIIGSHYASRTVKTPPLQILEVLAEKIHLTYNEEEIHRALT
ncbi:MAG TPA: hypothetical protein PK307_02890 [Spirochaetota bacterium]|nr:hypothetical protein [Spirochaetota bacterium]HOD14373.1 hypothetical protein [Spirochaetota bacterium]HPG52117.1 hypothetical protein [Spirochaetota bacterium]HPN12286.1 hypothetical protein [Spirochaetota bacterium]HQL81121.1 hypothetical protein [Spirochaetota bacterium]